MSRNACVVCVWWCVVWCGVWCGVVCGVVCGVWCGVWCVVWCVVCVVCGVVCGVVGSSHIGSKRGHFGSSHLCSNVVLLVRTTNSLFCHFCILVEGAACPARDGAQWVMDVSKSQWMEAEIARVRAELVHLKCWDRPDAPCVT